MRVVVFLQEEDFTGEILLERKQELLSKNVVGVELTQNIIRHLLVYLAR